MRRTVKNNGRHYLWQIAALALLSGTGFAAPVTAESLGEGVRTKIASPLDVKYEKDFPRCEPLPLDLTKAKVVMDNSFGDHFDKYFKSWNPSPKEVKKTFGKYYVVTEKEWHNVSHVGGNDRTGWITLVDGTRIAWLLRPAGIGKLVYPDGGGVYLLACCDKKKDTRPCS